MAKRKEVVVRSMSGAAVSDAWTIAVAGILALLLLPFVLLWLLGLLIRWCYRKNKVRLARKRREPIPTWTTRRERLAKKADEQRIAELMRQEQERAHEQELRAEAARRARAPRPY